MEAETYNLQVGTVYSITLLFFLGGGRGGECSVFVQYAHFLVSFKKWVFLMKPS